MSEPDLLEAGMMAADAAANGGIQTLTVEGDTFVFSVRNSPPDCHGTLSYEAEVVSAIHAPAPNCGEDKPGTVLFSARWTMEGDDLVLDVTDSIAPIFVVIFGSQPWARAE